MVAGREEMRGMQRFDAVRAVVLLGVLALGAAVQAEGPVRLQVDNLTTPLGIDNQAPNFSWQLEDTARGARQTAYQLQVASSESALRGGHGDVWDSGRVAGDRSLNVRYAGPALKPGTRYWWRVTAWGADGKAYAASAPAWWETGLLAPDGWRAAWIGYETAEEAAVRQAPAQWIASPDSAMPPKAGSADQHFAYRTTITLAKPVKRVALYATAQDTVSAWVNGKQTLDAQPFPPYRQMPWKKFVRADVTALVAQGANTIALEQVRYARGAGDGHTLQPMIATLFVEYADGSTAAFVSDGTWKTSAAPVSGWQQSAFNDAAWPAAALWSNGPDAGALGKPWIPDSVKALRHAFNVDRPVKSARLYATALGAYEFYLNGQRVGHDLLTPGWTDYRERVVYQTYDVTALLATGRNALGALLAPGWYETPLEWFQQPNNYGLTPPALRAQLRIEHTDGSVEWVATEAGWDARTSEVVSSEIYDGETVDARRAEYGWSTAPFNAKGWARATAITPTPVSIVAQNFEPIRVERELHALAITEPKPGVYIFDFGQNHAGVERLSLSGTTGASGTDVRIRFGELLNDDGTLYTENLRTAKATDHFILAGGGAEEFTPRFTFHGYRYAEITGLPARIRPDKNTLTALVIHSGAPFTAGLATGSTLVNKLWSNIQWGQRSNFVGVPTDCPQRDERLGWTADAQVFWRAATYNMDLAAFSRKYAGDLRGTQAGSPYFGIYAPGTASAHSSSGAGWSDAGVVVPWTAWLQSGDTQVIDENWSAMEKYLAAIEAANPDHLWKNEGGIPFGDWLAPEGQTQYGLVATAYWAYDAELMRQMAHATGRTTDEQKYAAIFEKVRAAFQKAYVRDGSFILSADKNPPIFGGPAPAMSAPDDTQTGYVLALHMNLLPEAQRAAAAEKLVAKIQANHGLLATGFLGTPYLLEELTKTGHTDVAYQLLMNTRYPSWGYLVEHGATTMWERWNGDQMKADPGMNSYNHYAYGAVADWIARYAAGVDTTPLDAGFHTVVLQPHFDARLGSLDFKYDSSYGPIHSAWTVKGNTAEWHVTLPANTTGLLPLNEAEAARWSLAGTLLAQNKLATHTTRNGQAGYELPAGEYNFTVALP